MDPIKRISQELNISSPQVSSTVELLDSGNTIPFISRYRKEVTGGLDEEQIRNIAAVLDKIRALDERRATVMKSIQGQGLLTEELKAQILAIQNWRIFINPSNQNEKLERVSHGKRASNRLRITF